MSQRLMSMNAYGADVHLTLLGLGVLGAHFLTQTVFLANALEGYARKLEVNAVDDRTVTPDLLRTHGLSERQLGQPLAYTMIQRVNQHSGYAWRSTHQPDKVQFRRVNRNTPAVSIVVTALGSVQQRQHALTWMQKTMRPDLWLDLGCDDYGGQAILGELSTRYNPYKDDVLVPAMHQIHPELFSNPAQVALEPIISDDVCRAARIIARLGGKLVWEAVQIRHIHQHGYYVNLDQGQINSLTFTPPARNAGT